MATTKYFAYVDAPLDLATPVADIVALFTDAVWLGGAAFTGLRFTAPTHINESIYGVLVEDAFSFTSIIASPDSGIPQDVTSQYTDQDTVTLNRTLYRKWVMTSSGNWRHGGNSPEVFEFRGAREPGGGGGDVTPADDIDLDGLRQHIETDLTDAALQRLLNGAHSLIHRQYGAPEAAKVTLVYPRGNWSNELPLPERAASVQRVEWYGSDIDSGDYTLAADGFRVLRNEGDWLSREYYNEHGYRVHYTAASDLAIRVNCIIELVRLDVAHTGEQSTTVAGVTQSQRALRKARADILSALNDRGRAWVR